MSDIEKKTVYFDNSATTPVSKKAAAAMLNAAKTVYGNPSSLHDMGLAGEHIVNDARAVILSSLGVSRGTAGQLIFCGSGTEANNLAVRGTVTAKKRSKGGKIIISAGEHASVEETVSALESEGYQAVRIPTVGGVLDFETLEKELTPDTILVSIMLVNNETGAVYDVKRAFDMAKRMCPSVTTHCDAVQGYMKVPFTAKSLGADLITLSAHKIHGSKGTGVLYIDPAVIRAKKIVPIIFGGGQEFGLRSGTYNVPGIAAFGAAAEEGINSISDNIAKMKSVRDYLVKRLSDNEFQSKGVKLNCAPLDKCAPHILNITLPQIKSETMLHFLSNQGIYVSSGSACSSHKKSVSRALTAFGLNEKDADCSLRISLCPENTSEEADIFMNALLSGINSLASIR